MNNKKTSFKRVDIVFLLTKKVVLYMKLEKSNSYDAYRLVRSFLVDSDRERFVVVFLDTENQPVSIEVVSKWVINSVLIYPRDVLADVSKVITFTIICQVKFNFSKKVEL